MVQTTAPDFSNYDDSGAWPYLIDEVRQLVVSGTGCEKGTLCSQAGWAAGWGEGQSEARGAMLLKQCMAWRVQGDCDI